MKRLCGRFIFIVLLLFVLSACNQSDSPSNTISVADLTDRENTLLSTTADQSFVFDFETDGTYKKVTVWVEKYEAGEMVDERLSEMTTEINENGFIVFANPKASHTEKQQSFQIGIGSNGTTGSITGNDSSEFDYKTRGSGSFPEELSLNQDELVLANISYSNDEAAVRSLTTDFYENPEEHINQLKEYDVTYLLKAEFIN